MLPVFPPKHVASVFVVLKVNAKSEEVTQVNIANITQRMRVDFVVIDKIFN